MPQYMYTAVNRGGEKIKGSVDAPNENEARVMLRSQQLRPLTIAKAGAFEIDLAKLGGLIGAVKSTDVLLFTRQLSILVSSGIPLMQGLEVIAGQIQSPAMKRVVLAIKEKVTGGSFLWEAMQAYRAVFPDVYISMVKAGEASGSLDPILKRLTKYLDDANKLKKLVQGALIYPIAITAVGIVVTIVMLVFVIPKFEELLTSSGQELPEVTRMVIAASHFVQHNILYIIAGLATTGYLGGRYVKTDEGRAFFDYASLKVPLFGQLLLKVAVSRFARTMQTLLSSGINLLDALDICRDAVGNKTLAETMVKMRLEVEKGKSLGAVMDKMPIFPSMVVQMVTVGESTGNVDKMLERVADYYEEDVQALVGNLTKMIEPFVLVFLGGLVGGLMIAMYLPIFKLAGGAAGQ
ncbi:MAG: type II secretion system F family protein [Bdellovibrionota bacterium]